MLSHAIPWLLGSIRRKILFMSVAMSVLLVLALAGAIGWRSAGLLGEESEWQLQQSVAQSERALSDFLDVRRVNADFWARNPIFNALIENPALSSVLVPSIDEYFRRVTAKEPWLESIILVTEGQVSYDNSEFLSRHELNGKPEELFAKAFADNKTVAFTAKDVKSGAQESFVAFTTPLHAKEPSAGDTASPSTAPETPSFLVVVLIPRQVDRFLFESMRIGRNGFATAIFYDEQGKPLAPPRRESVRPSEWKEFESALGSHVGTQEIPREWGSVTLRRAVLKDTPSVAVVGVASLLDVRAPVVRLLNLTAIIGAVCGLLAIGAAQWVSTRLARPIHLLSQTVADFGAGNLEVRAQRLTHDETGELADNFNAMAESLAGSQQALRERIADVEFLQEFSSSLVKIQSLPELESQLKAAFGGHFGHLVETFILVGEAFGEEQLAAAMPEAAEPAFSWTFRRSQKNTLHGRILARARGATSPELERFRRLAETLANNAEMSIENILSRIESARQAALEVELKTAQAVQESLFSSTDELRIPGWEIASWFTAAAQMGGDWFRLYFDEARGKLRVYMGDVTGHGVSSALITAVAMSVVHSTEVQSLQTLSQDVDLLQVLENLNVVVREAGREQLLMTFCICEIDVRSGEIRFTNAAHNAPFILRQPGEDQKTVPPGPTGLGATHSLLSRGNRLGYCHAPQFELKNYAIEEGSLLVLYTDGLIEARNGENQEFGLQRLKRVIAANSHRGAAELRIAIVSALDAFRSEHELEDDVSFIVIRFSDTKMAAGAQKWI